MSTVKVLRTFSSNKYSDAELGIKAGSVLSKMTGNPSFPEPVPPLETLQSTNTSYLAALDKVADGTKEDTAVKNRLRAELETLLKQLAGYVQQTCRNNEAVALSSGFDIGKKPSVIGPLEKATGLTVKVGSNKGSVVVECDVVENARFYEFEYTDAPSLRGSIWTKLVTTKRKLLIEELTSGKQYIFRVAGAGADPSRNWSDEISSYVL